MAVKCDRGGCVRVATAGPYCRPHSQYLRSLGVTGRYDITPTRRHVEALLELKWSRVGIAAESGVAITTLRKILNGTFQSIRRDTERKLRSIPLEPPRASGALIDSIGARRRVDSLRWMGWPVTVIAQRSGVRLVTLHSLLEGGPHCSWSTHRKIAEAYDEMCMTTGPSKSASTRARKQGAVSPLCWDDIDDPSAKPEGVSKYRRARYLGRAA